MNRGRWRDPKVYVGVAVSVFFLWLAFRKIEIGRMGRSMAEANLWLMAIVSAQVLFMLFVRGYRWTLFLKPIGPTRWVGLGWSTCIGFAVNNLLPARLGEVARSISASRKTGFGFGAVFGSVVVERIYDTLSILALLAASLFAFNFNEPMARLTAAAQEQFGVAISQRTIAVNLAGLVAVIGGAIAFLKLRTEFSLRVAGLLLRPLPARWRERVLNGVRNFISGLTQSTEPADVVTILLLSLALWIISIFSVWIGLIACGIDAGATDAIFVIMAMVLAVSIPASPGYVGTYHFLTATAITLTHEVSWERAMSAAIVIHLANYLPQTLSGLFALAREGLTLKEIENEKTAS